MGCLFGWRQCGHCPTNIFLCCSVGLPAASGGIVATGVAAYLHPGPLVVMRTVGTEDTSHHCPASNMRLKADPLWLGSVEWRFEVGCWLPKPVKWNISRHRGGQKDKRVGSVAACHWWSIGGPPCKLTLNHPVGEGWLADQWQLAPGGPLVGCWCYVCRVNT